MRIDVITLFPELFSAHLVHGVTRRAFEPGRIDVHLWPLRTFGDPPHARVDDRPYGGGPGMVLLVEPLERALDAIRAARAESTPAPLVSFSPAGAPLRQATVAEFAAGAGAILLCARYEGVDQRFVDAHVDLELSIGDYVLSGGELPALVLLDALARLQPGVLGDARSHQQDSFSARPARLPALQPSRAARQRRRRPRGAALGQPRGDRCLEARAIARADRRPAAGPARRRPCRGPARRRRRGLPGGAPSAKAIISGFSILCAREPCGSGQQRADPIGPQPPSGTRARSQEPSVDMIQTLEREEIARLNRAIPNFAPGDTVVVNVNVVEGTRKRVQAFEGVVISKRNRSLNSSFIVRKVSSGEGVERTFQTYSPLIASIEVKRRGDVRRAKLYYLRERSGKSARIKEKLA